MAEVLVEYDAEFRGPANEIYTARACGRGRPDDLWEGWLEFVPQNGASVIRTGRETTQPNRDGLAYWAQGLTSSYIEGALNRATAPPPPDLKPRQVTSRPAYDGPAEFTVVRDGVAVPTAVLDPYAVYAEGDTVLRGQLNALDDGKIRNIIKAYALSTAPAEQIDRMPRHELIETVITGVEKRAP
jgi:hypothetical protein